MTLPSHHSIRDYAADRSPPPRRAQRLQNAQHHQYRQTRVCLWANIIKLAAGGWFPLLLAAVVFMVMMTWKKGRRLLAQRIQSQAQLLEDFLEEIGRRPPTYVPGVAVFLNSSASRAPQALLHNLKHNKVLHERVIF